MVIKQALEKAMLCVGDPAENRPWLFTLPGCHLLLFKVACTQSTPLSDQIIVASNTCAFFV